VKPAPRPSSALAQAPDSLASAFAAYQGGDLVQAKRLARQALDRNPKRAGAWHLAGVIDMQSGHLAEALAAFDASLLLQPTNADVLANRGLALHQLGRHAEAVHSYGAALNIRPDAAQTHNNRGMALADLGDLDVAQQDYQRAIQLQPDYAAAHYNLGLLLLTRGQFEGSLTSFDTAIGLAADHAEAHASRGLALHGLKRYAQALASYDQAISLQPAFALAYNNRGLTHQALRDFSAAVHDYQAAIAYEPSLSQAYSNLGTAFKAMHCFDDALLAYDQSLAANPAVAQVLCNRGAVLQALQRADEARACFDEAIALDADLVEAHCHRAYVSLLLGDWVAGWQSYEWRAQHPQSRIARRNFSAPRWTRHDSLQGKTILVHSEQGLGDTLQFCRFVSGLAYRGAHVVFEVQRPLFSVLQMLSGVGQVLAAGDDLPGFDFHCPLMSLPLELGITEAYLLDNPAPYLAADPDKLQHWARRLGARRRPRVGLVWNGGFRPEQPELWSTHERRNISLAEISTLNTPGVDFFSLQKGEPAESQVLAEIGLHWPSDNFFNYAAELKDFSDTAAIIANLDLVISVDTSTAHLAAAMGKPVWLLNRFDTCWRWQLHRRDSPWYPTLTLFRQTAAADWSTPLQQIRVELLKLLEIDAAQT
jgi:tetratricopeptide (TPR) repeat protein